MIQRAALILALLTSTTQAWWRNGHMLTAKIAYNKLSETHPEILEKANQMLSGLSGFTTFEKNYPFVECATFADEIKDEGFDDQSHWHYVDAPFIDNGYNTTVDPEIYNVTWAINEFVEYLSRGRKPFDNPSISYKLGEGFNLRYLIHYVGDIHQPLHTVSRYTSQYPDGDAGGNLFMLKVFGDNITELHALWDSVVTSFDQDIIPPFDDSEWDYISSNALKIQVEYPEDSFTDLDKPFTEWAEEGYALAVNFVYKNIVEDQVPSDEYIQQGIKLAHRQIAKGGYRLANLLIHVLGQTEEDQTFLQ